MLRGELASPQGIAYRLIIQYQLVIPESIYKRNIIQTDQAEFIYLERYMHMICACNNI